MKWTDVRDIALALAERHPDADPRTVRFIEMHQWIIDLPGFDDDPKRGGEKILEAVQMTWIEETD
jgi:FeS assembly protein IscX